MLPLLPKISVRIPAKTFLQKTGGFLRDVGQGITRSIASAGVSFGKALTGQSQRDVTYQPRGRFEQAVFGKEPVKSLERRIADNELTLKRDYNVKRGALPLAFGGVIASTALDLLPGGKPGKVVGETALSKLVGAIRKAKPLRVETEALYTAERAKRALKGTEAIARTSGENAYKAALGSLKGRLPRPQFSSVRGTLNDVDASELFDMVKNHPKLDFFDRVNTWGALSKILDKTGGEIPTESELKLLKTVFGDDLIDAVKSQLPMWDKVKTGIAEVLNIPRTLMSSMDMSAPLRQGLILSISHPKKAATGFFNMVKYFGSERIFKGAMESITTRPGYGLMKESGLYFADTASTAISLTTKEEQFMSNFAQKIPLIGKLVKGSERAYVGFLNKLRADVFDDIAGEFRRGGIDPAKQPHVFTQLADFVNTATGRGKLGPLTGAAPILNGVFFSPRYMASRLQMLNPSWYFKMAPPVRKEAAKTLVKFVGTGLSIISLAKLAGADVETDPRSSDFGKIRIGKVRYDTWAGFQQWVRFTSQLITGKVKSSTTGKVSTLNTGKFGSQTRLDTVERFFSGKLAPLPGMVADILRGTTLIGEDVTVQGESIEKIVPIYMHDIAEAVREEGLEAGAYVGLPAFFGVGTQVYDAPKEDTLQLPELPPLPKLPKLPSLEKPSLKQQGTFGDHLKEATEVLDYSWAIPKDISEIPDIAKDLIQGRNNPIYNAVSFVGDKADEVLEAESEASRIRNLTNYLKYLFTKGETRI